jgi:hypothetical protein
MACAAYLGCENRRQGDFKPAKGNEMTHYQEMLHKAESLPRNDFTFDFTSAI